MKTLFTIARKLTDSGLIKPLPLTGLGKEIARLKNSKNKINAYARIGAYILGGLTIYGLIFKGLAPETASIIFKFIF